MQYIFLLLIFFFSLSTRFFLLDKIPSPFYPAIWNLRVISASLNVLSLPLIYIYSKKLFSNTKIALVTVWIMASLPWVIEQGRIYSPPGILVFFLIIFLLITGRIKNRALKSIISLSFFIIAFIVFPQFWLFRLNGINSKINYLNNFFTLLSPDILFFRNSTYWWVGVKEVGMMWVSFIPFFLLGIFELSTKLKYRVLIPLILIFLISFTSPYFPESREFYIATPFLSIVVAYGIYKVFAKRHKMLILLVLVCLLTYEMSQFMHYYYIHYPQDMSSNKPNITEPF